MIVKLLTEHHLEILSLKGGCRGLSQSTHFKMPHCWKSHALAQLKYSRDILVLMLDIFCCCLRFVNFNDSLKMEMKNNIILQSYLHMNDNRTPS